MFRSLVLRRILVSNVTLAISLAGLAVGSQQADAAVATPPVATTQSTIGGRCHSPGQTVWNISGTSHKKKLTHVEGWAVPPGVSVSKTKSVERVAQLKATVSSTTSASASVEAKVLGKVEGKVDVQLAAEGSVTRKSAESVTWTIPAAKQDRFYAMFAGRTSWKGGWFYSVCKNEYWHDDKGKWASYQANIEGGALCKVGKKTRKNSYSTGSMQYLACAAVDWGN